MYSTPWLRPRWYHLRDTAI